MFDKIKQIAKVWKKPLLFAIVIVTICYLIWLFTSFQGKLTLDKIIGNYSPPPEIHVISIYESGEKIASYIGLYSVEQFDDHIILMNHEDNSKISIYGDAAIVLDEIEEEGEN
jgi:hypothetical protein